MPSLPAHPLVEKKEENSSKGDQDPVFGSFVFIYFNSSPLGQSAPTSEDVSIDSGVGPSIPEPKPLALMVIDKPVVGKPGPSHPEPEPLTLVVIDNSAMKKSGMPHDLRVDFGERHHKRLYEAIEVGFSSVKGAHLEGV